jgi:hypothetical protein
VPFEQAQAEYRERRRFEASRPTYVRVAPAVVATLVLLGVGVLGDWSAGISLAPIAAFVTMLVAMLVAHARRG